jgi:hypothetical protein
MNKLEVKFVSVVGFLDLKAEFWMNEVLVEDKWLTAEEEDALGQSFDLESVRKGERNLTVDVFTIMELLEDGALEFITDDGDWTNFESILWSMVNAVE